MGVQYDDDEKIISLREFAELAGVSFATAHRMRIRGELPIIRLSPRRIGLRFGSVKEWLREREATANA